MEKLYVTLCPEAMGVIPSIIITYIKGEPYGLPSAVCYIHSK
jgi:hypothetical protein